MHSYWKASDDDLVCRFDFQEIRFENNAESTPTSEQLGYLQMIAEGNLLEKHGDPHR